MKPGIYWHYKGGFYRVLFSVHESTNAREGGEVVIYLSLTTGRLNARDKDEFEDFVTPTRENPNGVPRFAYIGESVP